MQSRKPLPYAIVAVFLSLISLTASAQPIPVPNDAGFVVRVDLNAMRDTRFGELLTNVAKSMAAEELDGGKKKEKAFEDIETALGFDPFDELRSVTIHGHNLADPREGLQIIVGMGNTTGNLEGLMLTLPGYKSWKHRDYLIHSVAPDDDVRVHVAIHGGRTKRVVISTTLDGVESMLDTLDNQGSASRSDVDNSRSNDSDAFVTVHLNQIPELDDLEGPPEAVVKLLKQFSLSVSEIRDNLNIIVKLRTEDDRRAEQLQQLAQGLVAMLALIQDSDDADEDLDLIADVVKRLEVKRDGSSLELNLEVPEDLLIDLLRDKADFPVTR